MPRAFGGTERYSNLRLLHNDYHVDLHKRLSRKRMTEIVKDMRLDYISATESVISFDLAGPCTMKVARTVWRGQGACERPALPYLNFAKLWSK